MKEAYVADIWRRVFSRTYATAYNRLNFKAVQRLGSGEVSFDAGITAIVGGNGVGKSTLLSTVLRSLGPAKSAHDASLFQAAEVEISGTLTGPQHDGQLATSLDGEGIKVLPKGAAIPAYIWIDPSTQATELRSAILSDANFEENLEGIDAQKYDDVQREIVSYIVGRKYEIIEVYEVADYGDLGLIPYFRVSADGLAYDSRSMGLGELSLFLIHWKLNSLENDAIVLVEEPETHISPKSQARLMNVCADICLRKGMSLIVTTHSPFVIERLPRRNLRLLVRNGSEIEVISSPASDQVARVLGDRLTYHGAILVEDEQSRCIVRSILRQLAPELLEYYEIVVATAVDGVIKGIDGLPKLKDWFSLFGILDGEQRDAYKEKIYKWPHGFLPNPETPEALLQSVIQTNRPAIATQISRPVETLNVACDAAAGLEAHEWIRHVRQALSLEVSQFTDAIVQVWLSEAANQDICKEIISRLHEHAYVLRNQDL